MPGSWHPSLRHQLRAEGLAPRSMGEVGDERIDDLEWTLHQRALDGDVEALWQLREQLHDVDYDELGWGD